MAKFGSWKNGYLKVGTLDVSDHAQEMSLEMSVEALPHDAHGDGVAFVTGGLLNWSIRGVMYQDFAAGSIDATLYPYLTGAAVVAVIMRPDNSAVTVNNPEYSGSAILVQYQPMGGRHGSNMTTPFQLQAAGSLMLSRRTS